MPSLNELKPDHKNARRRTTQSSELIKESLTRYGAARSIVIDEEGRVLAGNGTLEGAKAAGLKNVRVIDSDGSEVIAIRRTDLSEDEKVGLALADNRTSDLSGWDKEMLHTLAEQHDIEPWFQDVDLEGLVDAADLEGMGGSPWEEEEGEEAETYESCLLYTSPSPRDRQKSRMPSSA